MNTAITASIAATTGNVYSNYRFALKVIIITCLLKQHTNGTVPEMACSFLNLFGLFKSWDVQICKQKYKCYL